MKAQELRNLSGDELLQKEKVLLEELSKLNIQRYTGRVEKPHKFALIKRDIARIRTILNQVKNGASLGGIPNLVNEKKDK